MTILYGGFVDIASSKGDGTHARELSANLRKLGNRVVVVAHSGKSWNGIDFHNTGAYEHAGIMVSKLALFGLSLLKAMKSILSLAPACSVVYMRDYLFCAVGILAKLLYSRRMVWEVNGVASLERAQMRHPANLLILPFVNLLERLACIGADRIVPVSKGIMDILVSRGCPEWKISLIENGVNVETFCTVLDDSTVRGERERLGMPESATVVCYVGAIRPWQGLEVLIDSVASIDEKLSDLHFLIVGGGEGLESLKQRARKKRVLERFTFTGALPYERVPMALAISDICVAPFRKGRAASPMKVYEYMASGKPIVVSRIAGLEWIEERKLGKLVEPEDVRELADAIVAVSEDMETAREMALRAQEYVIKNRSWLSVARSVEGVCEETVSALRHA